MDRYTKTVLTVIAGCLLVLVGNQIDFPAKAYAETGAAGADSSHGKLAAVTEQGDVYFMDGGRNIYYCLPGKCSKVLD